MTITLATMADYEGILALHKTYHTDSISPEDRPDGFVTTNFTPQQLEDLIVKEQGVTVAKDDSGRIVAYATAASWDYWSQWPLFVYMIDHLHEYQLDGVTLTKENSYQYGPACVHKDYRGTGLFAQVFRASLASMAHRYPIMATFVNQVNPRSYAAHTRKVGMITAGTFPFNNNQYYCLVCPTAEGPNFQAHLNFHHQPDPKAVSLTSQEATEAAHVFHTSLPGYAPTPLVSLDAQAKHLGIANLWVKDESHRFGLNAFKGLGGSYAIAEYLCKKLGIPVDGKAFQVLTSPETKEKLGQLTFVTATDGNHGRGVAWAARVFGHKSVVYMPKGSAQERLENIRVQGAEAEITDLNYDDAVRLASSMAEERGWVLIQDTAWEGYEDVPTHIMQGYTTLAWEIARELDQPPTHLFLQAGVGSVAGAVSGYFAALYGDSRPATVICEPDQADCLYRTARADDGQLRFVTGDMNSMMAGLCCGEPCTVSWDILQGVGDCFVSCADHYAARGMILLGKPRGDDPKVVSGESGAVTAGVLEGLMTEDRLALLRDKLGLNETSRVLLISTEGDTDRENYRRILAEI